MRVSEIRVKRIRVNQGLGLSTYKLIYVMYGYQMISSILFNQIYSESIFIETIPQTKFQP